MHSSRPTLTPKDRRLLIARQRLSAVRCYRRGRRRGLTGAKAAKLAGASVPTLWRWCRAFDQRGLDGLIPRVSTGRISDLEKLKVPKRVLFHVEQIALQTGCGVVAAFRQYSKTANCPSRITARLRGRSVPPSFFRAVQSRIVTARLGRHFTLRQPLALALKERRPK